jgi:CyaY protein
MSDSEFLELIEHTLRRVENALEDSSADVEPARSGNVLSLEFEDGTKVVINSQIALHELWVAARAGGFHYRYDGAAWRNTRDGSEFFQVLSELVSSHAGTPIIIGP